LSNCFAEACGYESHNRQRGNDAPDTPLLVKGEAPGPEVDVVIGGLQSNQANHQAAQELNPGRAVETEETELSMLQAWLNCSALAGQRRWLARTIFSTQPGHGSPRTQRDQC